MNSLLKVIRPEYVYLKLKPNNSIRNNDTHKLARAIATLYKNVFQNVKKEQEKLINVFGRDIGIGTEFSYRANEKVSYYIYMEKQKVEFYFIVPKQHLPFMKEKISNVWPKITIDQVTQLPGFGDRSTRYQMSYAKEDALSLAVDLRNNNLLSSNLNILETLEDGDRVGIFYNFIPTEQKSWQYSYKHTIEKVKAGYPVDRNKFGMGYLLKKGISLVDIAVQDVSEALAGKKETGKNEQTTILESLLERINGGKKVSDETTKKINSTILQTQIAILSESTDKLRQRNNARSLAQSFDTLRGDNSLTYKRLTKTFDFDAYSIGADRNKVGDREASNFLSIPGREILENYSFIDKVETQEIQVPEDLRRGVMCIGDNIYRGMKQRAYLSDYEHYRNLLTLLIGPTRAGKSNLIGNLCIDAIEAGECVIIFDFIKNNELSDEVARLFPENQVLNIDVGDKDNLQGLGYNEVGTTEDSFQRYENAKLQTSNLLALVNAINVDESRLSPKMERYLESAALVVFIHNGAFKDVFNVLQDHRVRHDFISKIPNDMDEFLNEYATNLTEIDDLDKSGTKVVGTKISSIVGIIDRLSVLKRNTYMELMLKKDMKNNLDLVEEIQKNQVICIRMPESKFPTEGERDICSTYWITKLWMALQIRGHKLGNNWSEYRKVNLIIDELYQVYNTEKFMKTKLSQIAKFICKPIISCHYINQLTQMRSELRSANTSYMLISGCDKDNYRELQDELKPFTAEDLANLKPYHSMNYIKCRDGYARFITRLPGKVEDRISEKKSIQSGGNEVG